MRFSLALATLMLTAATMQGWAQTAGERYAAAYRLTGLRLRAAAVCPGNKKAMIDRAFVPVSSREFVAFSKAYPETTKDWMTEGAGQFNDGVMRSGIDEACRRAQ